MGQWLTLPMFVAGLYLISTASRRAPHLERAADSVKA
jgi:prolipoprotein diacylglyceryltransferase